MIPAGYLLKHIVPPPGWLATGPGHIKDVCSVSDCVNDNVVDVQGAWQHNGFGLANSPDLLQSLAVEAGIDTSNALLFYFTAYDREQESVGWTFDPARWRARSRASSAAVADDVRGSPSAMTGGCECLLSITTGHSVSQNAGDWRHPSMRTNNP